MWSLSSIRFKCGISKPTANFVLCSDGCIISYDCIMNVVHNIIHNECNKMTHISVSVFIMHVKEYVTSL